MNEDIYLNYSETIITQNIKSTATTATTPTTPTMSRFTSLPGKHVTYKGKVK